MPAFPEAATEMKILDFDDDRPMVRGGLNTEEDDIISDRRSLQEISKMADRMSNLLQETRKINVETDDRLRQVEADLKLIAMEK